MTDMRSGICALCQHPEVVRAHPKDRTHSGEIPLGAVAEIHAFSPDVIFGAFVTFVCRRCGFTQWFAAEPSKIPIGAEHGTSLVLPSDANTYRR